MKANDGKAWITIEKTCCFQEEFHGIAFGDARGEAGQFHLLFLAVGEESHTDEAVGV